MNLMVCKAMRWWEKGLQPNMREVESARDLADSLRDAGDQLVVVDFFSPGCGGCRALHPKACSQPATDKIRIYIV
jgi:thiol-disulfide isomerase/thioredoxin